VPPEPGADPFRESSCDRLNLWGHPIVLASEERCSPWRGTHQLHLLEPPAAIQRHRYLRYGLAAAHLRRGYTPPIALRTEL